MPQEQLDSVGDSGQPDIFRYHLLVAKQILLCEVRTSGTFEKLTLLPGYWALVFFAQPFHIPEVPASKVTVARGFQDERITYSQLYLAKCPHRLPADKLQLHEETPAIASWHAELLSTYRVGARSTRGTVEALATVKPVMPGSEPALLGDRTPFARCITSVLEAIMARIPASPEV